MSFVTNVGALCPVIKTPPTTRSESTTASSIFFAFENNVWQRPWKISSKYSKREVDTSKIVT